MSRIPRTDLPQFERYIGIDYSGAQTATSSVKGLRVYMAQTASLPVEVLPPPSPKKYWTRRGIAEWLVSVFKENIPTIAGIDHSFSFPGKYFETHHIPPDWDLFLNDFHAHWPTDDDHITVDAVRDGLRGNGNARLGNSHWRRIAEVRSGAKSVFHFDVPGSVAKSTHAGLPWLRHIRREVGRSVHFWPFDGWEIPAEKSALAEIYPSLWRKCFLQDDRTADQQDAYAGAAWLRNADQSGELTRYCHPQAEPKDLAIASEIEGWILGVL
jgi:hypothetical protein